MEKLLIYLKVFFCVCCWDFLRNQKRIFFPLFSGGHEKWIYGVLFRFLWVRNWLRRWERGVKGWEKKFNFPGKYRKRHKFNCITVIFVNLPSLPFQAAFWPQHIIRKRFNLLFMAVKHFLYFFLSTFSLTLNQESPTQLHITRNIFHL